MKEKFTVHIFFIIIYGDFFYVTLPQDTGASCQ